MRGLLLSIIIILFNVISGVFFENVRSDIRSLSSIPLTPESQRDHDRRIRREIANSNERRRMQSINAGFQSLKALLPHADGEKLSKVPLGFCAESKMQGLLSRIEMSNN
uniref:BHLH domain-containing protein n=1 Tax=Callorhinchus milii TaxID=7868 RepID=A0A4W3GEZ8_CALMI